MIKISFKTLFVFIAFVVICSSCKRYDDDDRRYLKTPCGRVAKKWQLYKITDRNGRDYTDSLIYYKISDNNNAFVPEQSFTYNGLILELEKSGNKLCLETGTRGKVEISNKPFGSGYYELKFKRTKLKFDVRPHENTATRYFIDDYTVFKMTSDELIFGRGEAKVYFKVAD